MKQGDICRIPGYDGGQVVILDIPLTTNHENKLIARVVHIDSSTLGYIVGDIAYWPVDELDMVWEAEELDEDD